MADYASDWAHPTYDEGGVLPTGATVVRNDTGKPERLFTAEQLERGLSWLRDHYRDGSFRCPSGDEGGGACPDSPDNRDG
jgi:hypothetical protein